MNTTITVTQRTAGSRGFVALLLVTAGALLLAGRAVPLVGDASALVLGIELLVWAYVARSDALLVTGALTGGVGLGVLLAAGPLLGGDPQVIGGAFVLGVAAGFAVITAASLLWWQRAANWAWITAAVIGVVGVGVLGGATQLRELTAWAVPAVLCAGGLVVAAQNRVTRWLRAGRK
ncbi:hypothetical protein [Pseudonocardia sp. GCM10023141]|uniref:hypothetical protein n=1 Tax=Pseudonocardia sp. GCM10023141 TaxID=3252653 RepID=UPI00360CFCDC